MRKRWEKDSKGAARESVSSFYNTLRITVASFRGNLCRLIDDQVSLSFRRISGTDPARFGVVFVEGNEATYAHDSPWRTTIFAKLPEAVSPLWFAMWVSTVDYRLSTFQFRVSGVNVRDVREKPISCILQVGKPCLARSYETEGTGQRRGVSYTWPNLSPDISIHISKYTITTLHVHRMKVQGSLCPLLEKYQFRTDPPFRAFLYSSFFYYARTSKIWQWDLERFKLNVTQRKVLFDYPRSASRSNIFAFRLDLSQLSSTSFLVREKRFTLQRGLGYSLHRPPLMFIISL